MLFPDRLSGRLHLQSRPKAAAGFRQFPVASVPLPAIRHERSLPGKGLLIPPRQDSLRVLSVEVLPETGLCQEKDLFQKKAFPKNPAFASEPAYNQDEMPDRDNKPAAPADAAPATQRSASHFYSELLHEAPESSYSVPEAIRKT